jgi:cyclopropane-fatty-acyl-phospholipid synthase
VSNEHDASTLDGYRTATPTGIPKPADPTPVASHDAGPLPTGEQPRGGDELTVAGGPAASGASRAAIEHHYDVGRDFYGLWLDADLVYSCALWPDGTDMDGDLESAQRAKMAWHARSARCDGADRVLDVGCGWGAFARFLVRERRVGHVTGLTLSADQAGEPQGSAIPSTQPGAGVGLSDAKDYADYIDIRLEDWRDHSPDAPYDAVVSVGAFEHFARNDLPQHLRRAVYQDFFDTMAGWTKPGAWMSLQTIAYEDVDPDTVQTMPFLTEEIFPESGLPRLSDVVSAAEQSWRVVSLRSDPDHYAQTLRLWQRRLEANSQAATDLVGRSTYRRYVRYLRLCRALFEEGVCTLYRLSLQRRPLAGTSPTGALAEQQ